jgi:hypothetical protein
MNENQLEFNFEPHPTFKVAVRFTNEETKQSEARVYEIEAPSFEVAKRFVAEALGVKQTWALVSPIKGEV